MKITKWPFSWYSKKKVLLAFEFAVVLSDVAKQLKIEMTPEIVNRAETLIKNELGPKTASHFAGHMSMYALAILEPKD